MKVMWRRVATRLLQSLNRCRCCFSSAVSSAVKGVDQKFTGRTPFVISVEGNIGSGKSTLIRYLESYYDVEALAEPLHLWTNVGGQNALELLYQDTSRWSFLFNIYAQLTRADLHKQATERSVKILERSIYSTRFCFVESAFRSGSLLPIEYRVLTYWFEWLLKNNDFHLDLIVYLRADPEACYQRLLHRDRREEAAVPLSYLKSLHSLHDEWLIQCRHPASTPVVVLDANGSADEFRQHFEEKREDILGGVLRRRSSSLGVVV